MAEADNPIEPYEERLGAGGSATADRKRPSTGLDVTGKPAATGETKPKKDNLTTTELARLCGVSRFTILNWINRGKIRAVRTVGGHCRIPASEAISFLEAFHLDAFHNQKKSTLPNSLGHCWEYPQKTSCDNDCRECLIYGREIDYCFVVVRQFGKEVICCKGNCLSCAYFEEFFGFDERRPELTETHPERTEGATEEKRSVLRNFVRGVNRGVHRLKREAQDSP